MNTDCYFTWPLEGRFKTRLFKYDNRLKKSVQLSDKNFQLENSSTVQVKAVLYTFSWGPVINVTKYCNLGKLDSIK